MYLELENQIWRIDNVFGIGESNLENEFVMFLYLFYLF